MRIFLTFLVAFFVCADVAVSQDNRVKKYPEAEALIEKHLKAVGGKAKLLKMRSMHFKSKITSIEGRMIHGDMEVWSAWIREEDPKTKKKTSKLCFKFVMNQGGLTEITSDGKTTWMEITKEKGIKTVAILGTQEAEAFRGSFDPADFARYKKSYKSWQTIGKSIVGGRPAYEVKLTARAGSVEHHYFDVESGLRTGIKRFHESPSGIQVSKSTLSDYRDVNGILMAHKTLDEGTGYKQVTEQQKVGGYNVKIDPKTFAQPGWVKAELKKKKPSPAKKDKDSQ